MVGASDLRLGALQGVPDPFAQGFEIFAEDLPEPAAQILRTKKREFGDSIDNADELRQLMRLLEQTGGDMNGLARPEFKGLDGMSPDDMLQALIDWIVNGGAQQNQSRSLGSMQPQGNYSARPATWNGWRRASSSRAAMAVASSLPSVSSTSTANSSPPRRAAVSVGRRSVARRAVVATSSSSPAT